MASGHPTLNDAIAVLLGLIESTDRGWSWCSVSLLDEVDSRSTR